MRDLQVRALKRVCTRSAKKFAAQNSITILPIAGNRSHEHQYFLARHCRNLAKLTRYSDQFSW